MKSFNQASPTETSYRDPCWASPNWVSLTLLVSQYNWDFLLILDLSNTIPRVSLITESSIQSILGSLTVTIVEATESNQLKGK